MGHAKEDQARTAAGFALESNLEQVNEIEDSL